MLDDRIEQRRFQRYAPIGTSVELIGECTERVYRFMVPVIHAAAGHCRIDGMWGDHRGDFDQLEIRDWVIPRRLVVP